MSFENPDRKHDVQNEGLGACFAQALRLAGIYIDEVDEWLSLEEVKLICEKVGLIYNDTQGTLEVSGGVPMIIIYKTGDGRAHAEYIEDIGKVDYQNLWFFAIIEIPKS